MASPFRWFRKHQKVMMVLLILVAMFGFVFGTMIMQILQYRSRPDPVVVETDKYGDLDERELEMLLRQRRQVLLFLGQVQMAVLEAKRRVNLQVDDEYRVLETANVARHFERLIGAASEEAVVDTWLCAQRAEELGLVVSDRAIRDFIREVTEDYVTTREVTKIITGLNSTPQWFFKLLRHELLALRLQQMFEVSLEATTPAQRWEYYTRLKRQATIEAIPVPVGDYVGQVADPDAKTLREFFEQYKENLPDPTMPEPGFRMPHQIAVRYFKADVQKFMDLGAVTDEEALQYYEENRQRYDSIPAIPGDVPEEPAPEDQEEPGTVEEPLEEPAAEEQPAEQEGDAGEESAEAPPPAEEAETEVEDEPAEEPEEAPQSATEPDESDDTSSTGTPWTIRLASLLQEGPDEPEAEATEAPAGDPAASNEAAAPEPGGEPGGADAAGQAPAEEPGQPGPEDEALLGGPVLGPELPAEQMEPVDDTEPAGETATDAEEPAEGAAGPLLEPIPAVPEGTRSDPLAGERGERIRGDLAFQKAIRQIEEVFDRLEGQMHAYRDKWVRYEVDVAGGRNSTPPAEPDYEALARENDPSGDEGLIASETPLMSQWDFDEEGSGIGQSFVYTTGELATFTDYAFRERWDQYVAARSAELGEDTREQNRYLFWKVDDSEPHISFFDQGELKKALAELEEEAAELESDDDWVTAQEVRHRAERLAAEHGPLRQKVLETWKMVQARELAMKEAERLAEEAREVGLSLSNTFIRRADVVSPRAFSWLTQGSVPLGASQTAPRLSRVEGVEMAGPDFMRTVFESERGQITVAMNHPQTIAYVIRLSNFNTSDAVLQKGFEVDSYYTYMDVARADQVENFQAWREELRRTAGLKPLRTLRSESGE